MNKYNELENTLGLTYGSIQAFMENKFEFIGDTKSEIIDILNSKSGDDLHDFNDLKNKLLSNPHPIAILMKKGNIRNIDTRNFIPYLPSLLEYNFELAKQVISNLDGKEQEEVIIDFFDKTLEVWERGVQFARLVKIVFDLGLTDIFVKWYKLGNERTSSQSLGILVLVGQIELAHKIFEIVRKDDEAIMKLMNNSIYYGINGTLYIDYKNRYMPNSISEGGMVALFFTGKEKEVLDEVDRLSLNETYFSKRVYFNFFRHCARSNNVELAKEILKRAKSSTITILETEFGETEFDRSNMSGKVRTYKDMVSFNRQEMGKTKEDSVGYFELLVASGHNVSYSEYSENRFLNTPLVNAVLNKSYDFLRYLAQISEDSLFIRGQLETTLDELISYLLNKGVKIEISGDKNFKGKIEELIDKIKDINFNLSTNQYSITKNDTDTKIEVKDDFKSQLEMFFRLVNINENQRKDPSNWINTCLNLFSNIDEVGEYLNAFSIWAGERVYDVRFYGYELFPGSITNKDIKEIPKYSNDRFFSFAFDFLLQKPLEHKNKWIKMMISYPEISRYMSQANEIEIYMKENNIDFPDDLVSFKELVLRYNLSLTSLSQEQIKLLNDRLINQHQRKTDNATDIISLINHRDFDCTFMNTFDFQKSHEDIISVLSWLGVIYPYYIGSEENKRENVGDYVYREGTIQCRFDKTQSNDVILQEIGLVRDILLGMGLTLIDKSIFDIKFDFPLKEISGSKEELKEEINNLLSKQENFLSGFEVHVVSFIKNL